MATQIQAVMEQQPPQTTPSRFSPETCGKIMELHAQGVGACRIAKQLGATEHGIRRWLRKRGLRTKNTAEVGRVGQVLKPAMIEKVLALHGEGRGAYGIAKNLQLRGRAVYSFLRRKGLRCGDSPELKARLKDKKEQTAETARIAKRQETTKITLELTNAIREMSSLRSMEAAHYLHELADCDFASLKMQRDIVQQQMEARMLDTQPSDIVRTKGNDKRTKLTQSQKEEVLSLLEAGDMRVNEIASRFGIGLSTLQRIRTKANQ